MTAAEERFRADLDDEIAEGTVENLRELLRVSERQMLDTLIEAVIERAVDRTSDARH